MSSNITGNHIDYELLHEAGELEVRYEGPTLDAFSLGIIEVNLHEMAEKVAANILIQEGVIEDLRPFWRYRRTQFGIYSTGQPVIRLRIFSICQGSIEQELGVAILGVFSDPFAREVLSSIIGDLIYSISKTGVRGVIAHFTDLEYLHRRVTRHSFDIGTNIRAIIKTLTENSNGKSTRLTLSHKKGNNTYKITLDINSDGIK